MRKVTIAMALAFSTGTSAYAAEPVPVSLAMDGPWVANYDNDSCQLIAKFKRADAEIIARFTRYESTDVFDLALYGAPLKLGGQTSVRVAFGPGQNLRSETATTGTYTNDIPLILFSSLRFYPWTWPANKRDGKLTPISLEQEAAISSFTIQLSKKQAYRLETGSMREPMAEMRKCMDGLIESWGYDSKTVATLSRPAEPRNNPGLWVTSSDYPGKAMMLHTGGIVQFRLDVDTNGRVLGCHILARTSPDVFADHTCQLLRRRAQFRPALNSEGTPVKGFFVSKVRFSMPD